MHDRYSVDTKSAPVKSRVKPRPKLRPAGEKFVVLAGADRDGVRLYYHCGRIGHYRFGSFGAEEFKRASISGPKQVVFDRYQITVLVSWLNGQLFGESLMQAERLCQIPLEVFRKHYMKGGFDRG